MASDVTSAGRLLGEADDAPLPLSVSLLVGDHAIAQYTDPSFRAEWTALRAACPWGTVFQGPPFVTAWWRVYAPDFAPWLVLGRDEGGRLCGLLQLARDVRSGRLHHVGTHHAEYQTWLAHPERSDAFITAALHRLADAVGPLSLRFHFLAPRTPLDWIPQFEGHVAPRCFVGRHARGVVALQRDDATGQSLRKRSNRSKLRRLAKLGEVKLLDIHDVETLERWLPTIVAHCDARQGAVHGTLPFLDDPRKADFYRECVRTPGLMHATVLVANDDLLAAHLGPVDGDRVLLGLIAHAPEHGVHSPGKLLLHLLSERLAETGFREFDLTPGGHYKERFATSLDVVESLEVQFSSRLATWRALRRQTGAVVRKVVGNARAEPRQLRRRLSGGLPHAMLMLDGTDDHADLLARCAEIIERARAAGVTVRVNETAALLQVDGAFVGRTERLALLREAVARLERGALVAVAQRSGVIVSLAWADALSRHRSAAVHRAVRPSVEPSPLEHHAGHGSSAHARAFTIELERRRLAPSRDALAEAAALATLLLHVMTLEDGTVPIVVQLSADGATGHPDLGLTPLPTRVAHQCAIAMHALGEDTSSPS